MVPVALVGRVSSTVRLSRYLNEILLLATGTICAFCVTSRWSLLCKFSRGLGLSASQTNFSRASRPVPRRAKILCAKRLAVRSARHKSFDDYQFSKESDRDSGEHLVKPLRYRKSWFACSSSLIVTAGLPVSCACYIPRTRGKTSSSWIASGKLGRQLFIFSP